MPCHVYVGTLLDNPPLDPLARLAHGLLLFLCSPLAHFAHKPEMEFAMATIPTLLPEAAAKLAAATAALAALGLTPLEFRSLQTAAELADYGIDHVDLWEDDDVVTGFGLCIAYEDRWLVAGADTNELYEATVHLTA